MKDRHKLALVFFVIMSLGFAWTNFNDGYNYNHCFFFSCKLSRSIKDIFIMAVVTLVLLGLEYWEPSENPNTNKDIRMMAFLEMLKGHYQFFWVLITPQFFDDKTKNWKLTSWIPIRITSTDQQIEALIKSSDQSVEEKAKSIGIYTVIKVRGYVIEEGKLIKTKEGFVTMEVNC